MKRYPLSNILFFGSFFLIIIAYILLNNLAGYTFPIPWADEGIFLWQSISFQINNTFVAPQLNPTRPLLLMPPGYMIFNGFLFKIVGFSLDIARKVSLVLMIGVVIQLVLITRKYGLKFIALLFIGLFFLNSYFLAIGNIARMEALLLFLIFLGFLLLQNKKDYEALAILALTPLIHPNGVYFLLAAIGYLLFTKRLRINPKELNRREKIFIITSLIIWLIYIAYILLQWDWFIQDITFQIVRKSQRDILRKFFLENNFLFILIFFFCLAYGIKEKIPATFLLVIVAPSWLINKLGQEMWYAIFDIIAYLMLSLVVLHITSNLVTSLTKNKYFQKSILLLITILLLLWLYNNKRIGNLFLYPESISWSDMRFSEDIAYINNSDISEIQTHLDTINKSNQPFYIQFFPRGDALLFQDLENDLIHFSQPVFYSREPDVYIIHSSKFIPEWMEIRLQEEFENAGIDPSDPANILFQRDETEIWYYRSTN